MVSGNQSEPDFPPVRLNIPKHNRAREQKSHPVPGLRFESFIDHKTTSILHSDSAHRPPLFPPGPHSDDLIYLIVSRKTRLRCLPCLASPVQCSGKGRPSRSGPIRPNRFSARRSRSRGQVKRAKRTRRKPGRKGRRSRGRRRGL